MIVMSNRVKSIEWDNVDTVKSWFLSEEEGKYQYSEEDGGICMYTDIPGEGSSLWKKRYVNGSIIITITYYY